MVEIFKTNAQSTEQAIDLLSEIRLYFPELRVNFDLEDCDNILRVEGIKILKDKIIKILVSEGYFCEVFV